VSDLETSRIGAPYIYDISHLRVNSYAVRVEIGLVESVSIKLLYGYAKEKDVEMGIVICIVTIIECRNLT
jgi:hypothetical protein